MQSTSARLQAHDEMSRGPVLCWPPTTFTPVSPHRNSIPLDPLRPRSSPCASCCESKLITAHLSQSGEIQPASCRLSPVAHPQPPALRLVSSTSDVITSGERRAPSEGPQGNRLTASSDRCICFLSPSSVWREPVRGKVCHCWRSSNLF